MKRSTLLPKLAAMFALLVAPADAQTASASAGDSASQSANGSAAGDSAIELSPFVVSASSDVGWVATETLAGSRLRTNFKDVPNQIETLTKDFMQDLGLTNFNEALIYTANVENDSEFMRPTAGDAIIFPGGSRVRGIGGGTLSRNFFKTESPTDNYNIERATVASGPNAILFGLGSPAGILDATPARALMRNRYGVTLRYDSENSKRGTFDANVVAIPQKLSFRLMGLSKREYTEKQPNLDRNDRLFGTLTFNPFKNTTLVLQGERNSRAWNSAGRITPVDFVTPWLTADQIAGSGYTTAKPVYDNSSLAGINTNLIFNQFGEAPILIRGGSGQLASWRNSVIVRGPGTLPGLDPTFDAGASHTIRDPSVFPLDVNVMGTARISNMDSDNKTVILEQKLASTLFLELAYNREDANKHQLSGGGWNGGVNFPIHVDANRYIPGTTTPNPHLGEYYYQGTAGGRLLFYENEDWRATLSYELDLARKLERNGAWGKWLGRHRFAGLYTESRVENRNQTGFDRRILDDPAIPGLNFRAKTFQNWATHATRNPQFRYYLNEGPAEGLGPFQFGDWTLIDANGRPYSLYAIDTPLVAADGKRLGGGAAVAGVKNEAEAMIFAWQGFFLPDRQGRERLVLTYGARKDTARSAGFDAASTRQDFSGLFPLLYDASFRDFDPEQSGINRNIGIVARPFHWLSLSYNKSTTFDLNVGRFDPYGNALPGAGGDGRDYGIRLDLWQDKLSLKVNKYKTVAGPQRAANLIHDKLRTPVERVELRVRELDPGAPTINVTDGNQRGFPTLGAGQGYNVNSDFSSTGYELELNFTPTRNWNLRVNGAKSEAVESNIGGVWVAWANERLPVWQGVVAKNGEVDSAGRPVTWATAPFNATNPDGQTLAQYYESTVLQGRAFVSAVDGRANSTARPSRANAIVNYRFHEGRLKGFNVGGAFRWRSAPNIGYGVTTVNGQTILDLSQSYMGKAERFVDFMAGYRGRVKTFGGVNYHLQLNVRNLLNENDPVPVAALTTGAVYRIATIDSRVTSLTFGVDF